MCKTESFRSHTCPHTWKTVVEACHLGGFNGHQGAFQDDPARKGLFPPRYIAAPSKSCPSCDKKGDYDGNQTRIELKRSDYKGNLGNGYNMTDGYGQALPVRQWNSHLYGQQSFTGCGMTRTRPVQQREPGCGCTIM